MWLTCSSIGRKLVMAITGACLVLFITFHCLMNGVAIFWPQAYNVVCEFLGANWYALVATVGLAALFIIHIIYAVWLTLQNRKARGNDRYLVVSKPPQVEWASQNMLVLGIVILAFLVVHMIQFWAKMQLAEILHCDYNYEGMPVNPAAGTLFLHIAFSQIWTPIVYIIGFIALWFHMNHGFWSMFQTCGWNGDTWMPRLKAIGCWWTTIVVALFIAEAVVFTVRARSTDFPTVLKEYVVSGNGLCANNVPCGSDCNDCAVPCGNDCNDCAAPCGDNCNACVPSCGNDCNVCTAPCANECNVCTAPCGNDCANCTDCSAPCGNSCSECTAPCGNDCKDCNAPCTPQCAPCN